MLDTTLHWSDTMDTTTPTKKYLSVNELSKTYGFGRDTFVRLLTALLVDNTNIRGIKIGTKTMYRRAEIDALMLENSHLG